MSRFKMIQITNNAIGAVAANANIPLGTITRRIDCNKCNTTFSVASSTSDTVVLNEAGYYKVTYSITAIATDTGLSSISLIANGASVYTVGETVSAAGDAINLTLPFYVRVFDQNNNIATNNPLSLQVRSSSALTSATANMIVEKLY